VDGAVGEGSTATSLAHPTPQALLLVVRERGMPLGRLRFWRSARRRWAPLAGEK